MKTCSRCGKAQPVANFSKRACSPDGLHASCRSCQAEYGQQRRELLRSRSDEEVEAAAAARGPKKCRACEQVTPIVQFTRDRSRPDGMGTLCLSCAAGVTRVHSRALPEPERQRRRAAEYRKNRRAVRNRQLRATFGITIEQYEAMARAQKHLCAICGNPEKERRKGRLKRLCVDHCHTTGVIRGLLCSACNKGLGTFRDLPDVLRRAAAYLEHHQSGDGYATGPDVGFVRRPAGQLRLRTGSRPAGARSGGSGGSRSRRVRHQGAGRDPRTSSADS